MHIFFKLHPDDEAKIDALLAMMRRIEDRQIAMAIRENPLMKDITAILQAVTAETSLASSAALALNAANRHLSDALVEVDTLKAQLAANTLDPAQVQTLLDTVATASAQLSAAIPANTTPTATATTPVTQPVLPVTDAGTVVTTVSTDAPGTVSGPTESQAASPTANIPAVPVTVLDPAAPAAVVVQQAP